MSVSNQTLPRRTTGFVAYGAATAAAEPVTERWPLAARASLVMSMCGLFWGGLGAVVLHLASR